MLQFALKFRTLLPMVAAFVALLAASPALAQTTGSLRVLTSARVGRFVEPYNHEIGMVYIVQPSAETASGD